MGEGTFRSYLNGDVRVKQVERRSLVMAYLVLGAPGLNG